MRHEQDASHCSPVCPSGLRLAAIGCSSDEADSDTTQASHSTTTSAMETRPETTTVTTASEGMASTTTTAFSRPLTTEMPAGGVLLDNGDAQFEGYVFDARASHLLADGGPFGIIFVPAAQFADQEEALAAYGELAVPDPDQRKVHL